MRCRYCTFSGNYKYERTHENKHMKIETARKAIDYFFSNNSSSEKRAITFYGGEVLTRFDMMKEVVSYARGIDSEVGISFTTNGTLLTEKVLQYLIHNRIGVNVSLDGDIDMNDRNRVLRDGSGSFKLIMNNLKKAKDMDSDYFRDKISYISVLTPPYELEKVRDFFYRSDFFDSNTDVTTSPVYLQDSFMFEKSDLVEFQSRYDEAVKKMLGIYETALIEGKGDNFKVEKQWFEDLITGIHFREKSPIEDTIAPLGQCLPGSRRLFCEC